MSSTNLDLINLRNPFNDPISCLVHTNANSLEIQLFNDACRRNIVGKYLGQHLARSLFTRELQ